MADRPWHCVERQGSKVNGDNKYFRILDLLSDGVPRNSTDIVVAMNLTMQVVASRLNEAKRKFHVDVSRNSKLVISDSGREYLRINKRLGNELKFQNLRVLQK